jgi:hypothetical protein
MDLLLITASGSGRDAWFVGIDKAYRARSIGTSGVHVSVYSPIIISIHTRRPYGTWFRALILLQTSYPSRRIYNDDREDTAYLIKVYRTDHYLRSHF